jgi:major membrane immunogen (membrane-anchored lipoprotein)
MKKIILAAVLTGILFISACDKPANTNSLLNTGTYFAGSGTWTYDGIRDSVTSCLYDSSSNNTAVTASNYTNSGNYTTIRCGFSGPVHNGTYTVVANPTQNNQTNSQMIVEIDPGLQGINGNSYYSSGAGLNQTVTVSIVNNKVTIYYVPAGTPNASDTSTLSLNISAMYN